MAVSIAGIDFSTRFVDVVLLDETTDAAKWERFELIGQDAFDRTRGVRGAMPTVTSEFWDDVLAVGIEQPRGNHGVVHMARLQGAILACIPLHLLVHPLNPATWKKAVGLSGNATKNDITLHAETVLGAPMFMLDGTGWAQDAYDAYCIALATRSVLENKEAA